MIYNLFPTDSENEDISLSELLKGVERRKPGTKPNLVDNSQEVAYRILKSRGNNMDFDETYTFKIFAILHPENLHLLKELEISNRLSNVALPGTKNGHIGTIVQEVKANGETDS